MKAGINNGHLQHNAVCVLQKRRVCTTVVLHKVGKRNLIANSHSVVAGEFGRGKDNEGKRTGAGRRQETCCRWVMSTTP